MCSLVGKHVPNNLYKDIGINFSDMNYIMQPSHILRALALILAPAMANQRPVTKL